MTTIAFDGKTLAVDSMTNCGSFVTSRTTQKLWRNVGAFPCVAMAGPVSCYPAILDWLEKGADPLTWNDHWDAVAWVVESSGQVVRYLSGYPERIHDIDVDGSGAEIALGALAVGATARQALAVAIKYDLYTGGEIQAFDIKKHLAAVS